MSEETQQDSGIVEITESEADARRMRNAALLSKDPKAIMPSGKTLDEEREEGKAADLAKVRARDSRRMLSFRVVNRPAAVVEKSAAQTGAAGQSVTEGNNQNATTGQQGSNPAGRLQPRTFGRPKTD